MNLTFSDEACNRTELENTTLIPGENETGPSAEVRQQEPRLGLYLLIFFLNGWENLYYVLGIVVNIRETLGNQSLLFRVWLWKLVKGALTNNCGKL